MRGLAIIARWFPFPSSGAGVPGLAVAADPIDQLRAEMAASLDARRASRRSPPSERKRFEHARPKVAQLARELAQMDRR